MRVRSQPVLPPTLADPALRRATALVALLTLPTFFAVFVNLFGEMLLRAGVTFPPAGWERAHLRLYVIGLMIGAFGLPLVAVALGYLSWRRRSPSAYAWAWTIVAAALVLFWTTNADVVGR